MISKHKKVSLILKNKEVFMKVLGKDKEVFMKVLGKDKEGMG
ncbi:hypothetical protein [Methanosarcina sp. DH1]|nr:hypothetical protein [Methanosarcina sp. DH1]